MTKSLQILFGLLLILVLAYIAFLDVSTKIKDDLLTKTKVMLSKNNVKAVTATIQGEGLSMSRTLVLAGTAISDVERVRIVTLAKHIEGVCSIDNQITLYPVVPKAPVVPKVPSAVKVLPAKISFEASTPKKILTVKSTDTLIVENKTATISELATETRTKSPSTAIVESTKVTSVVSAIATTAKIPTVPKVESKAVATAVTSTKIAVKVPVAPAVIVVPTAVHAVTAPAVIEVEKIKLEGVK